ncbi:MAG: cardiolipin synthase [Bacteroides caccae]|nr:cardiolipin synthase [Bacteroides caccae]
MKLRIFILFLFLPLLRAQASVIDSLMTHPRDSIGLTSDSLVLHFLEESGIPISDNNKVKLLKSGREKFIDLFEAIRQAKHHVHLEYFNFRNDSIANALFALLAEKVKEGVEVRAMFDAFGNWSNNQPLKKRHLKKIREQGIEIVKFDPFTFPYINHAAHRDHRKIVVIDGEIAYTGGMNIADYYINGLPKIGTWRDMHMRIEGDAVNDLQEIFLTIWNKETKQNIGGEIYFPQHEDSTNIVVAIVDRTPKKNNVHIVNPYFVPTSSIKKALNRTIDRGVNVTIMVSSASDIPFTPDAALYKLHKLMKRGATVYMYNGGFHHSKIMMIDDLFCTVGTANLNSRSLRYDYETNAFIFDKKTTAELNTMFRNDIEHCTQLTPEFWKKRSPWKKFVGWFANLFTPFL